MAVPTTEVASLFRPSLPRFVSYAVLGKNRAYVSFASFGSAPIQIQTWMEVTKRNGTDRFAPFRLPAM